MSTLRRLSLTLSGVVLRLCLFFGCTLLCLVLVFGNPNSIKDALSSTNAYSRFTDAVIESGRQQSTKNSEDIPFDDPEVQNIIKNSFDQQTLQKDTEAIVDGIFMWLNGETAEPKFSIDLTDNKTKLANGLADYAVNRLASLPACQSLPAQTNIYRITCQPVYLDIKEQRQAVYSTIMSDTHFLKDTTVTFDTLVKHDSNFDYQAPPRYFGWFKTLPWILLIISLLLSLYIVFASRTRRQGFKKLSSIAISVGIALAIAPIISYFAIPSVYRGIQNSLSGGPQSLGAVTNDISGNLYTQVNELLINSAIQVVALGILIRIVLHFTRTKTPYGGVKKKAGLSSSVAKPARQNGLSEEATPVQTSERKAKTRKPSSIRSKYRKI